MKAHPGWSCGWRPATGAADLATGIDSPVSTPSSHSSSSTSSKRRSAGTRSPMRSDTTSPGTRSVTGTRLARPSLRTSASCRILARSDGHRHLRPVLVEEAQTDAEGDDHGDDQRRSCHRPSAPTRAPLRGGEPGSGSGPGGRGRRWRAPDGCRARSARSGVAVPPRRRTRAHPVHFPAARAPPPAERAAASAKPSSPRGASTAMTMQAESLRQLILTRDVGHGRRSFVVSRASPGAAAIKPARPREDRRKRRSASMRYARPEGQRGNKKPAPSRDLASRREPQPRTSGLVVLCQGSNRR